jgi:hypothetical protein
MKAANTHPMHPFQVFPDAVFGDVAIHPVPPYAGLCFIRWANKISMEDFVVYLLCISVNKKENKHKKHACLMHEIEFKIN